MYTKKEIITIIQNCKTMEQLYTACACIKFLVENKYQTPHRFMQKITLQRVIELQEEKL